MVEKSGYGEDGIFRSPYPPLLLPKDEEHTNFISFMFRNSASYAHKTALIDADSGEKLCFKDFQERVKWVGSGLYQLGIRKGDVVLIFAPNSINFPLCFLGIISIGGIATTVNPLYTTMEVTKQVQDSMTKLIFTIPDVWHKVEDLGIPTVMIGSDINVGFRSRIPITLFSEVLNMGANKSYPQPVVRIRQRDTAALLYSSGTTGVSKGVMLSHRNFMASASMVCRDQEARGERGLIWLCLVPMFHVYGLSVVTLGQLQAGNAVVSMAKFDLVRMLRVIQEYKVTHLPIVPPIVMALAKSREIIGQYDVSSLKEVICAAAPIGRDVMEETAANIPTAQIIQGYGLTEACGAATIMARERNSDFGSVGTLFPSIEAKITSLETGNPLPPKQQGEICIRGLNVMAGYFNDPNATKYSMDTDGWLHTGDLGYFDENGNLFIIDRIKELIKCKGFQVAPAELEALLLKHSKISDAAVIRQIDPRLGEVPIAYVVLSTQSSLKKKDVMEFISKQGYGLTETCGIATMTPRERKGHFGSSGTLVSGIEAKITTLEMGKPLPPNQRGEIWLRGSNIMAGYFNNPSATKGTIDRDGWLHTGDLGYFDENGNLYIVDRIKELIKCKGYQVAPAELEGLLLTHPEIVDAAVIGQPDLQAGEVPIAYIVLSPGSSLKKEDVMEFVSKQVAPFKRLHNVTFLKIIPKSASGKILRRELVQNLNSKL